jgi:hypothetical protein
MKTRPGPRTLQRPGLMLDSAWDDKTVTGARLERHLTAGELNLAPDDVHQLFMQMAACD